MKFEVIGQVMELALERHYTIKEIAEIWGLCENSVRVIFRDEPGVVKIERPAGRWKRTYTSIRIPQSVLERVHRRMSQVAQADSARTRRTPRLLRRG